MNWRNDKSKIF